MSLRGVFVIATLVGVGYVTAGIVPPDAPVPALGELGAPIRSLSAAEEARFIRGRALFNRDFGVSHGVGPVFNGDSCRACHQDPVIGGGGGRDVQVQRPAISDGEGGFTFPPETGPLAQLHAAPPNGVQEIVPETVAFVEKRNSPTLLGLGLVEQISAAAIQANADPEDGDEDGIFGIAHDLGGGLTGRLGWKAQVPDLRSFVRDAMGEEMGITVPVDAQNNFGQTADTDAVPDPELTNTELEDMVFFLALLDFPRKAPATTQSQLGETLFTQIGCAQCHIPTLDGVELYSNLLLHDVLEDEFQGVTQGEATSGLYRTPPLRGLRFGAPYFHDGTSETIEDAVRRHAGEATGVMAAFDALTAAEQQALLAFLATL